jgi:hypothetical protein
MVTIHLNHTFDHICWIHRYLECWPTAPLVRICDPFPRCEVSLPLTKICHSKDGCCKIIGMSPLNKPNVHVSNLNTYYATSRGLILYLAQDKITLVATICGHVIVAIVPTKVLYVYNLHFKSYMGHTMNPTPTKPIIVIQGILSTMLPFIFLRLLIAINSSCKNSLF